jgi:hypothetical protein
VGVVGRQDTVGRLDVGLAVDAQFGDQQPQQRLGLLGLTVGDQRFELAGYGGEECTSSFALVNDSTGRRSRRVVHGLWTNPRCSAMELRGTPRVLVAAVAFGTLDRSEHEDVGYRLELAQLAP